MHLKKIAAVIAFATTAAASQASTLTLTPQGDGTNFATFDGNAGHVTFDFIATAGDLLDIAALTSTWTHTMAAPTVVLTGYHITDVKFDGVSLSSLVGGLYDSQSRSFPVNKVSVADSWTLTALTLTGGTHTIDVYGSYNLQPSQGFTGNITITPVPEPTTYGMLLGGLGALTLLARRRKT